MLLLDQITVLVPVYNNQETVQPLVSQVRAALGDRVRVCDFVFVEDAGTDGSRAVLRRLAAHDPHLLVVENPSNIGQQASIRAGLAHCKGDAVVVMDADLQDPPTAVPDLVCALVEGDFDAVFAARVGRYQSSIRTLTGRLFRRVMIALTALPQGAGGFVIMRRDVASDLAGKTGQRFYLPGMIGCGGYRLHAIPVARAMRPTGVTAYTGAMRWKTACSNIAATLHERVRHVRK